MKKELPITMTLTLKPSRNKKNQYKIYLDDEFLGCLPQKLIPAEYFLTPSPLGEGRGEVVVARHALLSDAIETKQSSSDNDTFISFIREHVLKQAQKAILDYLAKAERTSHDCKIYLKRQDIPDNVISFVIDEAKSKQWLSDERYAELYTEDAIMMQRSPLNTKHKLLQKRIPANIIDKAIKKHYDKEKKDEIIEELIDKLLAKHAGLKPDKQFEKIATALYNKGFEYGDYEALLHKKTR